MAGKVNSAAKAAKIVKSIGKKMPPAKNPSKIIKNAKKK